MIQEIKTEEKNFPFQDFKTLGYESYVFGQKSYNGVAFLSKISIAKIDLKFIKDKNNFFKRNWENVRYFNCSED